MSTNEVLSKDATRDATVARLDMKFEVVVIPVADVDRAKEFYGKLAWRLDADFPFDNGFRVLQFTAPGSGCSIQFGTNITSAAPGSAYSTPGHQALSSSPTARTVASAGPRRITPATAPTPRSGTRTATGGC
jgi:catechol 2,3-dioxygenase-like lactoylglutathione lyase family enzyme